jgi:hypothetical protein
VELPTVPTPLSLVKNRRKKEKTCLTTWWRSEQLKHFCNGSERERGEGGRERESYTDGCREDMRE